MNGSTKKRVPNNSERIPPWEKARIVVRMQEEERRRKMRESSAEARSKAERVRSRNPSPLDSLDANRRRLLEIRKRMLSDQR